MELLFRSDRGPCARTHSAFFSFALDIRDISHPYNNMESALDLKNVDLGSAVKLTVLPDLAQHVIRSKGFS